MTNGNRIAVAAGKRNEAGELKRLVEIALPKTGEALHDWQAVVIGGVVAGVSEQKHWPRARVAEVIAQDIALGEDGAFTYRTKVRLSFKLESPDS